MVISYTDDVLKKIKKGRSCKGISSQERQVPYKNFAHLFIEKVRQNPENTFLTFYSKEEGRTIHTYASFYEQVCKLANVLINEFNVKENDCVASVAYNHEETVVLMFACFMVGACYVPINATEDDERISFVLNNSNVKILFVMPEYVLRIHTLRPQLINIQSFIQFGKTNCEGFISLSDLLLTKSTTICFDNIASLDSSALLVYTSGTTGSPKGVLLSQYNCLINAQEIVNWYGFDEKDRAMLILPIHHVNGIIVTLLTPLFAGASIVLNEKFSASAYWQIITEEKCTYGSVVPTVLSFLCEAEQAAIKSSINDYFLICGAGPLTVETAMKFTEMFNIKVNHGYGLSETTCYSSFLPFNLSDSDYKKWMREFGYPSIGKALPCNEMDIHDTEGQALPEGEKGEIVIRGHNIMECYYGRPDANAEAFEFNWFRSGDEGFYRLDDEGQKYFFITGRLKELIIRGGVNYSPLEIDEVINQISDVKAGMAVGFENNMYGEEVGAYVVLAKGSNINEEYILNKCACLPYNKRPKVVVIGNEFPVTSTGKYQRNKLKPLFLKWKNYQFREEAP